MPLFKRSKIDFQAIPNTIENHLRQRGFDVGKSTPRMSYDIMAKKGNTWIIFDIKKPEQDYLTYDSIAQAKYEASVLQDTYYTNVIPIIVGSFTVSEGAQTVAESNRVMVINIPKNLDPDRTSEFISDELKKHIGDLYDQQ